MDNAIELYNQLPSQLPSAISMGDVFAKSGLFGTTRAEQGMVLAIECIATRQTPLQLIRTYHVIDGRLSKKALAIAAEFRTKGGKIKWKDTAKDGKRAEAEFTYDGQTLTESFTIEEAQRQGLIRKGSAWEKTPGNMLRARLLSNTIAMLCPEIVAGVSGNPEDENEASTEATKPIFSQPSQQPQREIKPAKVVDVTPVTAETGAHIITYPPPPAPSLAVVDSPSDGPQPLELVTKAEVDPASGRITAATVQTLESLIKPENCALAMEWLKAKGQIKTSLLDLAPDWAQRIIDAPDKFIKIIGGAK